MADVDKLQMLRLDRDIANQQFNIKNKEYELEEKKYLLERIQKDIEDCQAFLQKLLDEKTRLTTPAA